MTGRMMLYRTYAKVMKPMFEHRRRGRVVMMHHGRCGSTVLGRMLGDHRKVFWAGEILKGPRIRAFERNHRTSDYRRVIDLVEVAARWHRYCGFEIKYEHFRKRNMDIVDCCEYLEELRYVNVILLERKNYLRREISRQVAIAVGHYHVGLSDKQVVTRIRLETDGLLEGFERRLGDQAAVEAAVNHLSPLRITYEEDIQNNPKVAYNKVCERFNIDVENIEPKLARTNPFPIQDMLSNFDAVAPVLEGTRHEWMLYE